MKLLILALKNLTRHRLRSLLTILGVAAGMFLYAAVQTMQHSLSEATEANANDTTLVVYRENRFCPTTSRLPEHYLPTIQRIEGVREVIPIQIAVNNCGASLDVITFRGVPPETLKQYNPGINVLEGSYEDFTKRSDAALVGVNFAQRRGLKPGDKFEAVGVNVYVAGIISSDSPQDNNVAYVHLPFLQQASRIGLGIVTQFNVRVDSADQLDSVAAKIDETFRADQQPTNTRPEKAFFAETAKQMIELIGFTRWLGLGAVLAVLGLVANAVLLIVRGRVKETAILQTLGFSRKAIAAMVMIEGILLGLIGGVVGIFGSLIFFHFRAITIGNEGLTLALSPDPQVVLSGMTVALLLGLLASVYPAWKATARPLVNSLSS
ncbi:ABC transporter permease [Verrucomicrobiaceae bacterium R5-34]|uniref:ABC transporter permease n=1 Tax=Oceaniferula flava TaxID=2800421 RepID=A0AAE2SGI9_9BACT|nr:ABC transporter permease [Oceaniferula flavus]MBK1830829.1 ABC transporter permease [Verrucomicrobiaceae bacterium R5-34]MBK1856472.1 ABC transporter permease [Oceaniferula flavus]MBM1137779.1 ABC transporter permease [Oceaniferula flavus]